MKVSNKLSPSVGTSLCKAIYNVTNILYTGNNPASNDEYGTISSNAGQCIDSNKGFISIINTPQPRVKFSSPSNIVNDRESAFAITTGMLKCMLKDISASLVSYSSKKPTRSPLLRDIAVLVDVIRYFDEIDANVLEFPIYPKCNSVHSIPRNFVISESRAWLPLSDRFQPDAWDHHLKTEYPSFDTSGGAVYPPHVMVAEVNRL
jgi:hypothetical protein